MKDIIIVDDLIQHIQLIKDCLYSLNTDFNITSYQHPEDLLNNLNNVNDYTIFILDICLDDNDGIKLAKTILDVCFSAQIIFISSYLNKAVEIYDITHCYFVYKPDLNKYLPNAITKALSNIKKAKKKLTIKQKDKLKILNIDDIYYIERIQRYSYIHSNNEIIKTASSINDLLSQLPFYFIRCHNSFVFNSDYISEIKRTSVKLKDQTIIPISRNYQNEVKEKFHDYLVDCL
ncbi:LytTR family DNA-binding domain-containing protein [Thomasclavelia sp.]|uniref:LytR/AlgR family response regulator transcription factor n=1 Tax=Thomasclavelia sp. TaxID=3025757 RepID=UPI0025DED4D1|nr:LytTR family DNA-binding domain-containing protein [Thomasclavelia sp.]